MKFCVECGAKMKNESEFCYRCGAPYPVSDETVYMQRRAEYRKRKRLAERAEQKKRRGHIIRAAVFGAVIAALLIYVWYSPARRAGTLAMEGNIDSADSIYESRVANRAFEKTVAKLIVPVEADAVYRAYNHEAISYQDAYLRLEELEKIEGADGRAAKRLSDLTALSDSKNAYYQAEAYAASGDVRNAMLEYRQVIQSDERYDEAQEKADTEEAAYRKLVLDTVGTPSSNEEYARAIQYLTDAVSVLPDDNTLSDKLSTLQSEYAQKIYVDYTSAADRCVSADQYPEALSLLSTALEYNADDSDLKAKISDVQSKYEDYARQQVNTLIADKDYAAAQAIVSRLASALPDSTVAAELESAISSAQSAAEAAAQQEENSGSDAAASAADES